MLVAVSITTRAHKALQKRWRLEGGIPPVPGQRNFEGTHHPQPGAPPPPPADIPLHWRKEDYALPAAGVLGPSIVKDPDFAGALVVYDWDTGEIVWSSDWQSVIVTPHGFCFADGALYIADCEASHVFKVSLDEPGQILERISYLGFNDTHTVVRTKRGLLVANSGSDLIVEIDLAGNPLWEWWAAEHGFGMTPVGVRRPSGRGAEQRDQHYHTRFHTTHLNNAAVRGPDDRYVLTTLFHQGTFVAIDRSRPPHAQRAEVIEAGLARPHGPIPFGDGWIVANSLGKEFLIFDAELRLQERVEYDGGWIQDVAVLSNGRIVLNDVDFHRFVEFEGPSWHEVSRRPYDENWRAGEMKELPAAHEAAFRQAASVAAAGKVLA